LGPGGPSITFTARVSSPAGTPDGMVTFTDGVRVLGTVPLDANGQASLQTGALASGSHVVTAAYAGSAAFSSSSASTVVDMVQSDTGQQLLVLAPAGTTVTQTTSLPPNAPHGLAFPFGLLGFTIGGLQPGQAATVTLVLPAGMPGGLTPTMYEKFV